MSHRVTLGHPADYDGWRAHARALASAGVPAAEVLWQVAGDAQDDLLANGPAASAPAAAPAAQLSVPRAFLDLAERVIQHRDSDRFALLYTVLLRLQSNPRLLSDRADAQVDRLEDMAKAVARDTHKMRAFVRFREVADAEGQHFIAWFEPEHHIVRANAGFFIRRFANQRWTILTPRESIHWDGEELHILPGAQASDAPADDPVEAVWKTYYANIFNPARLKVRAMQKEMPKKYWRNMPETALVPELIATAAHRTRTMIEQPLPLAPATPRAEGARGDDAVHQPQSTAPDGLPLSNGTALDALRAEAARCKRCPLYADATQTVFGEGPADAALMFVGEQPGDQEDLAGRPFVGPAGQLFNRALDEAGVDRARAYVTNAVKHFKFELRGKRRIHAKPELPEIKACNWWLQNEREAIDPKLTVMLGATAGRAVLGRTVTIGKERSRILELPGGKAGFITVHPSYLLRIPDEGMKAEEYARFVEDLRAAGAYALA